MYFVAALVLHDTVIRVAGSGAAVLANILLAVWPSLVMGTGFAWTEAPSLTLWLVTLWAWLRSREDVRARWLIVAGTSLGIGILIRPSALLTPALLIALCLTEPSRRMNALRRAAVVSLMAIAVVAPWTVRNYVVLGASGVQPCT
jgi:4-amino-4-deoxy-L-arabinose transferase-like glycosyltransferase